jgi:cytochrome c biogenesis protein CcmG, thiol:disulfide interchange protein DsbE
VRRRIAWTCIAASAIVASPAASGSLTANQSAGLGLTTYPDGTRPPAFSGRTLDGRTVSLDALRGHVVLVTFWASWCLECRTEMPVFERLHHAFASQGLAIVGINVREREEAARRYATELDLTFPLVLDADGRISSRYGVIGLPTTFVIGRDGTAVALAVGPRAWDGAAAKAVFRTLLAAGPGGSEGR